MNDITSSRLKVIVQPRIVVATTTNTAQVRVVLCQPPTKQDSTVCVGVGRSVCFECVWEKKLEYHILLLRHSKFYDRLGVKYHLINAFFSRHQASYV